ncbi:MAG TPA: putative 2-aminoethylphosphonate ABC transporter permease subunit [Candidatus Methylomirabilis sp.]|nr:putative 2-aminoethylphosphonate ABC transporter permease subunit [Candidatus Methylomirabilis sp.]
MADTAVQSPGLARGHGILDAVDVNQWLMRGMILLACLWMVVMVVLPLVQLLSKSLMDHDGAFVGLANFAHYFRTPALSASLYNSLFVAVLTTTISVTLAFLYAYALTRTQIPGKAFFRTIALLPLFSPTLLNGITLVYLFGRKGLITTGFFGFFERSVRLPLAADIGLYGPVGIVIAEVFYAFPQAMLILSIALRMTDARLYEASDSLRASKPRTFLTVTIPGIKYGLLSATFVSFILCFTDFGAPKVVGGNYNVLATDIYKQVIGQQNFVMGATVSVVLLIPTVIAFLLDRISQRRQVALIAAKSVPLTPRPHPVRDGMFLAFCSLVALLLAGFLATAVFASLAKVWPYDLSLSLKHYNFRNVGGGGYPAFFNSIRMALYSSVAGVVITFTSAYLIEKSKGMFLLRQGAYFLSMLPLALPGLVIGLAYIFFFNQPTWTILGLEVRNPLNFLYGTMAILVLSNIVHFYTVSFLTATTALKQLDREFEAVSDSLGVPFYKTFFRVTVPVCMPAILEIGMYYFVSSMATLSAVIFLYSADTPLATVAVANMDDAGDIAPAAAMSVLIVLTNIAARLLYGLMTKGVQKRTQAWTRPATA